MYFFFYSETPSIVVLFPNITLLQSDFYIVKLNVK